MPLESGFLLKVAPRFHLVPDWGERLRINSGLERVAQRWLPCEDWRPLTPAEQAVLLPHNAGTRRVALLPAEPEGGEEPAADLDPDALSLFNVPERLRVGWWELVARHEDCGEPLDLSPFLKPLIDYCQFKQLPVPEVSTFDVLVSAPGERSIPAPAAGQSSPFASWRAVVNLGDESTFLLFQNASPAAGSDGEGPWQAVAAGLPVLRCALPPGEAAWLPRGSCPVAGCTVGKAELDVLLVIREA